VTAQVGSLASDNGDAPSLDEAQALFAAPLGEESALIPSTFGDDAPPAADLMTTLAPRDALPLLDTAGEVRPLDEIEAELIRYAITHYRGQMSEVARRLQIGRSTLYRKLEALGLNGERGEVDNEMVPGDVAAERQPSKIA
jgi:DNA-binding NtrC family response regulator